MGVVRGAISLIPVGPLPLAVGVVIAPVVAVANIQAPALLRIAI
jgi:hypothetical protein